MLNTFEQQLKYEVDRRSNFDHPAPEQNRRDPIGVTERVLYAELSHAVVGAAIEVHRHIGPGQLESIYQCALASELADRGIAHRTQVPIAMLYKSKNIGQFFADLIVDDKIILELKAVDRFHPVHTAQVLSYLRATNLRLGLLINFNVPVLWRGVRRLIR